MVCTDSNQFYTMRIDSAQSRSVYCLTSLFIILLFEAIVLFAYFFKLFDWLAAYSATEKLNSFKLFRAELQRFWWRTIYCLNNSRSLRSLWNIPSSGNPALLHNTCRRAARSTTIRYFATRCLLLTNCSISRSTPEKSKSFTVHRRIKGCIKIRAGE